MNATVQKMVSALSERMGDPPMFWLDLLEVEVKAMQTDPEVWRVCQCWETSGWRDPDSDSELSVEMNKIWAKAIERININLDMDKHYYVNKR